MGETILFSGSPRIIFGVGSSAKLADLLRAEACAKVFLICGERIGKSNILSGLLSRLGEADLRFEVYNRVPVEPTPEDAEDCLAQARQFAPDCVVGIGGGSSIDVAKLVAVLLNNEGPVAGFVGREKIARPGVFSIMIPTTAGSGAEVTPNSVLRFSEQNTKASVLSRHIVPRVALVDPLLTLSMDPYLTASTAMDALAHSLESFVSKRANSFSRMFSVESIKQIFSSVCRAVSAPDDVDARSSMSYAAMLAGLAISNTGTTVVHGLSYALTTILGIPHGMANAVLLPAVMELNARRSPAPFAQLSQQIFGYKGSSESEGASYFIDRLYALQADVGMAKRLSEFGAREKDVDHIARAGFLVKRAIENNPVALDYDDFVELVRKVF